MQRARDDALNDTELCHPHSLRRSGHEVLLAIRATLDKLPPPKTEDQKDRLGDGVEHPGRRGIAAVTAGAFEQVDLVLEEAAQHADCAARLVVVDEHRARHERRDVARGSGARDLGRGWLEQGVGDELAEKKVGECGVARGKPEEEELRVARFEGAEDRAGEDGEERVELRELLHGVGGRQRRWRV